MPTTRRPRPTGGELCHKGCAAGHAAEDEVVGELEKYTPMVMMLMLRVMMMYLLMVCKSFSRVLISI